MKNDNGDRIVNSKEIVEYVKNYFQTLFYDKAQPDVEEDFPHVATPLHKPITSFEVQKAIRKLKNGRAVGSDGINSELLKCAPEMIADLLAGIINGSLAHNEDLELGLGVLIALQKPGKPCGPVHISLISDMLCFYHCYGKCCPLLLMIEYDALLMLIYPSLILRIGKEDLLPILFGLTGG